MLNKYALIVANGDLLDLNWFFNCVDEASYVVAADGGAEFLHRIGALPDVVIGDLDSISAETHDWLSADDVTVKKYPSEKDETDLELALAFLIEKGWTSIQIVAAGGGRIDQFLANMLLLAHEQWIDLDVRIVEPHQSVWLFQNTTAIEGEVGDIVSLIPVGGDAIVRRTTGLQWELAESRLAFGPARGVSNRLTERRAVVELSEGIIVCCHIDGGWHR